MDKAIHKKTGEYVSAFKIYTSLKWKGREREVFIAPYHEVGNWIELEKKGIKEVEVSYVKLHIRIKNDIKETVHPHFRIKTEGAIENLENESEEHKLAKKHIYSKAINDEIILKIKSLGEKKITEIGEVSDIKIERGVGRKRADVLVKFKERDKVYGEGIAFEIQLSKQEINETRKRNYDRASYGYSIVWIWGNELSLNNNKYELIPFNEAIEEYNKQRIDETNSNIWDIDKRLNQKLEDVKNSLHDSFEEPERLKAKLRDEINISLKHLEQINQDLDLKIKEDINSLILEKINKIDINKFTEINLEDIFNKNFNQFINNKEYVIDKNISGIVKDKVNSYFIENNFSNKVNQEIKDKINSLEGFLKEEVLKNANEYLKQIRKDVIKIVSNEALEELKVNISSLFNTQWNRFLDSELTNLKSETVNNYSKNKISYYLQCPICNEDKHIMLFKINDEKQLVCQTCLKNGKS